MGSTGHGIYNKSYKGNVNDETFGIKGAVNCTGKLPEDSNLEKPGNNKITLKVASDDKFDIIFQFKLTKDNKYMVITAHDPNTPPVKAKVNVESLNPSIDDVIATGSHNQQLQAIKIKDMFAKSTTIKESQLSAIVNKLLRAKMKK